MKKIRREKRVGGKVGFANINQPKPSAAFFCYANVPLFLNRPSHRRTRGRKVRKGKGGEEPNERHNRGRGKTQFVSTSNPRFFFSGCIHPPTLMLLCAKQRRKKSPVHHKPPVRMPPRLSQSYAMWASIRLSLSSFPHQRTKNVNRNDVKGDSGHDYCSPHPLA